MEDNLACVQTDGPLTLRELCIDARFGGYDDLRWFWGVYGREVRARLHIALHCRTTLAA